jgi:hypothetical protein
MGKSIQRLVDRKTKNGGLYAALFFVALIVAAAALSLWIEDGYHKADKAYRLYIAQHPLKPGEKPPKVDWLTGKVWR